MNLCVALRAITEKSLLLANIRSNVDQSGKIVGTKSRSNAVSRVASQTKECCRLPQQIVDNCSVRLMADRTVLGRGRVFVGKWALLFSMTAVANLVDRCFSQVSMGLAVPVMAVRADHFAFLDRMM